MGAPVIELRRTREAPHRCRAPVAEAGTALSRAADVRWRPRLFAVEEVRPGGLGRRPETLAGGFELLEFREFPGAAGPDPLPQQGNGQARTGAHAERFRTGGASRARRP